MKTAVDLFSGAGGISLGIEAAGFKVEFANDFHPAAGATYRRNFPATPFSGASIRGITGAKILRQTGLKAGELDLLIGGPPCQGFSIIGSRVVHDERNDLFQDFFRIARHLRPRAIVIENVPGLATLARGAFLEAILSAFDRAGYNVSFAELLAAQYGVPQMRWRMVFIGFRKDLGVPSGMGFPKPTHGSSPIGALVPNRTLLASELAGFLTTRDAIEDLPPLEAGGRVERYSKRPSLRYQRVMREGAGAVLFNHYAPKLSLVNLERIAALQPGEDWRSLPRHLLPASMLRAKRKDHTRRYRRMSWDGVPRSIITRFRDPKSGEYSHPTQTRTISIREAARIQSFPDRFVFEGDLSDQYMQVGNAVPPLLAAAIGSEIVAVLDGRATHRLSNPFARRPLLAQTSLALHAL